MLSGWSIGGDLIPGYLINDHVLGYLRLGGVSTQFNAADTNQGELLSNLVYSLRRPPCLVDRLLAFILRSR